MANSLIPINLLDLRWPTLGYPSFLEEIEEFMPTKNMLNGLTLSEDAGHVYVEASVPGVDPKDVEVTYDKGVLVIKAEKKEEEKEKHYHRRATRSFFYRVAPGDIDSGQEPEAVCVNGVMKVTFAKLPKSQPKKIAVKTAK